MQQGTIKKLTDKGFGFIKTAGPKDLFFHSKALQGVDSLLSIVQMPAGVPVATMAIGRAGAINAALLAVSILGLSRPALRDALARFRAERAQQVLDETLEMDA